MDIEQIVQIICAILTGMATAIPLAIKLAEYVKKAVRERSWRGLIELTLELMENAEMLFESGESRREYVIEAVGKTARAIDFEFDEQEFGELIDRICAMSKCVNCSAAATEKG